MKDAALSWRKALLAERHLCSIQCWIKGHPISAGICCGWCVYVVT
jgi:hypothetical protein